MNNMNLSYLTIPTEAVDLVWLHKDLNLQDGQIIKTWKKNSDLHLVLDLTLVAKEIKKYVEPESAFRCYVFYESLLSSNGSGLHGLATDFEYNMNSDFEEIKKDIRIIGDKIAGSIQVSFCITLADSIKNDKATIYATKKGSILYEESIVLHLEGEQALFPVKAIDFSKEEGVTSNSLYYLKKYYTQLDSNFNTAYRLFFNTKHHLFKIINSDSIDEENNNYIVKMIMYDVYRAIVLDALKEDGLSELQAPTEEETQEAFSLASIYTRIVTDLLRLYFPDKDLQYLINLSKGSNDECNSLYTAIQSYILEER